MNSYNQVFFTFQINTPHCLVTNYLHCLKSVRKAHQLQLLEIHKYKVFSLQLNCYFREGDGTPLQYSCLEIPWTEEPGRLQSMGSKRVRHDWATSFSLFTFMPRDGEAWWAAVYGVAQSRTRLKWLSSSSSIADQYLLVLMEVSLTENIMV